MLTMNQKKAVTRELQNRYQRAKKKEKVMILNEFTRLTGYNRSYAARALRKKKLLGYLTIYDQRVKYTSSSQKRKKSKYYDQDVFLALKKIWREADYICSKRLAPFLAEFIPVLEKNKEIKITPEVREKLFSISADTRKKQQIKGRSTTKPGSLLPS